MAVAMGVAGKADGNGNKESNGNEDEGGGQ
jgi:hypothetical protein